MKTTFFILLSLLFVGFSQAQRTDQALENKPQASHWKLVWSDEFNYSGLPDPQKWDYEVGFIRNHESQYYTRNRLQNARVEHGYLIIEGRKEKIQIPQANPPQWTGYTSASLITKDKADWQYGRIEVRAKLPHGKGVWPAIWMLGTNRGDVRWPKCGEIDIMEFVGKEPNAIHATVHYFKDGKHRASGHPLTTPRPYDEFHVYALEWYPDRMEFYFDNTKYHTFQIAEAGTGDDNPFRKPQYLLLNLALGGSWGGAIDDAVLPQQYLIDYVRVYQSTGSSKSAP